ncbi:MAG: TRAP transporter substrate-binding protein [Pirellulales bacterium]|nr:TRAP transporter substrate-binding protein [Pirellulales bacterium]
MSKGPSYFIAGALAGVLLATVGFTWFVRGLNTPGAAGGAGHVVLKLAHGLDQQHPVHLAMEVFAQRVAEKSAGALQIEIIPNGQLGSETECLEQVQHGALAMTKVSAAPLESFIPEFAVFGMPYLFRSEQHNWDVLDGPIGRELLLKGESAGLRGLCYYDAGARSFYTVDKPILKPDDLKGLKIRVQESPTSMEMVEALGGSPTPISFGELYTALQQKMVVGAENNPPSFYSNRHFEVCKHYSLDEHTRVPDILMISPRVWDQLPPPMQAWLQEAADESADYQRQIWREQTEEVLAAVVEKGVAIHRPDQAAFAAKAAPMLVKYDGTPLGDLIRRIKEVP